MLSITSEKQPGKSDAELRQSAKALNHRLSRHRTPANIRLARSVFQPEPQSAAIGLRRCPE